VQGELAVQYQVKEETIGTDLSQLEKMLKTGHQVLRVSFGMDAHFTPW
jgi:hypothetical protein